MKALLCFAILRFLNVICISTIVFFAGNLSASEKLEELIITGKPPGPKIWKYVHENKILWVIGVVDYLPKRLNWNDENVTTIIRNSDVFLTPPNMSISANNPFKLFSFYQKFKKSKQLPKGIALDNLLSKKSNDTYLDLARKYNIKADLNLRPIFAAEHLAERALEAVNIEDGEEVTKKLLKLAKANSLTIIQSESELDINVFFNIIQSISMEQELACFDEILNQFDESFDDTVSIAFSWENGEFDNSTNHLLTNTNKVCSNPLLLVNEAKRADRHSRLIWLKQAKHAWRNNTSTFAYLPLTEIINPNGIVKQLQDMMNQ